MSEEEEDPPLPDLQDAVLDAPTLQALFDDLEAHTEVLVVLGKGGPMDRADEQPLGLREAQGRLGADLRAVQITYRYQGDEWRDTLMAGTKYAKFAPMHAFQCREGGALETVVNGKVETTNTYAAGDYILLGTEGERFVLGADKFHERYDAANAQALIRHLVNVLKHTGGVCEHGCRTALEYALITQPDARDPKVLAKLDAVAGRVLE